MSTRFKVEKALGEIFTKSINDSENCFTANYNRHFVDVITCLIDAETKSWRDAHTEAIKNIGILGDQINKLSRKKSK